MKKSSRQLLVFLGLLLLVTLLGTAFYMLGMKYLEHSERDFWASLMTVVESLTTTGFGSDNQWQHPAMNLLIILLQMVGLLLVFLLFPLYLIPALEERFQSRLPTSASDLSGHTIVFKFRPAVTVLIKEMKAAGKQVLVMEPDPREARAIEQQGHRIIQGRLSEETLRAAGLERARALIANGRDDQNATLALTARQMGFEGEIIGLAEQETHREAMEMAGCNRVLNTAELLAGALAARASEKVRPTLAGAQHLGRHLEICEMRVQAGSQLAGTSLGESQVGAMTGVSVIGRWMKGQLETNLTAETILHPNTLMVVVGGRDGICQLEALAGTARPLLRQGFFLVAGCGEVGRRVRDLLRDSGEEVRSLDINEDADLVGDVLDTELLAGADLSGCQGVVLSLNEDATTLFATVLIRQLFVGLPVFARVNEGENIERIRLAGADYALSVSQVAGRMMARTLLGREAVDLAERLEIRQVGTGKLVGENPSALNIRRRTGCSVVAVERGEDVIVAFSPDFSFEPDDLVYVCGSSLEIKNFTGMFSS